MNENENKIELGVRVAFDALGEIYALTPEMREFLFGFKEVPRILLGHKNKEFNIFNILDNKKQLLEKYVVPGDILERDDLQVLVTFVYSDHEHFDGIVITDSPLRGLVWKNTTIEESHIKKTWQRSNTFIIEKYKWE